MALKETKWLRAEYDEVRRYLGFALTAFENGYHYALESEFPGWFDDDFGREVRVHIAEALLSIVNVTEQALSQSQRANEKPSEPVQQETPAVTTCSCEWSDKPWHDDLVAIESSGRYWTVDLISDMVAAIDGDQTRDMAPNDFEAFVAEHNWANPREMARLARNLQYVFEQGRVA